MRTRKIAVFLAAIAVSATALMTVQMQTASAVTPSGCLPGTQTSPSYIKPIIAGSTQIGQISIFMNPSARTFCAMTYRQNYALDPSGQLTSVSIKADNGVTRSWSGQVTGNRTEVVLMQASDGCVNVTGRIVWADGVGGRDVTVSTGRVLCADTKRDKIVATAKAQLNKQYVYGTAGPNTFDCSGLVQYAYKSVGVSLPHNSKEQFNESKRISRSQLLPGDLIFYYSPISHVSIYIGNGKEISASNPSTDIVTRSVGSPSGYGRVL